MSFNSWKKEFYSPITKVAKKNAATHSLIKWIGLRPDNLEKHGLKIDDDSIVNAKYDDYILLSIDSESCSLCKWAEKGQSFNTCENCDFRIFHGFDCDDIKKGPYKDWLTNNNPEPMIEALQAIVDSRA